MLVMFHCIEFTPEGLDLQHDLAIKQVGQK
jgi:hypothetical protein